MKLTDKELTFYLKNNAIRYDKNNKPFLMVSTEIRRNSRLLISYKRLESLIEKGLIEKADLLKIMKY